MQDADTEASGAPFLGMASINLEKLTETDRYIDVLQATHAGEIKAAMKRLEAENK